MAEELKKISLQTNPIEADPPHSPLPAQAGRRSFSWKVLLVPLGVIAVIIIALGVMLLPLGGVMAKAKDVVRAGKEAAGAIKNQDLEKTKIALKDTRVQLTALAKEYNKVKPLKFVPILGRYVADGEHALKAGFAGLDAGDKAIEALEPNADLLGLKGKSTFVSGTADERIQTAVKTMNALVPKVNEMAVSIDVLRKELDAIDPARYPKKFFGIVVRDQLQGTKDVIENAANLFVNAQPLLVNLPGMLGEPAEKRYIVLFQNDKELRATGGFITAYAQFRFIKGKAILEQADDIYALDAAKRKTFPAPREILTFHKGVYNLNIRDSNLSPDYKVSMQQFEEMYDTVSGKEKIDGIFAVDTHVLVEVLRILGPTWVYGREFSSEVDKRCDCPKAVYELEDYSTRPVNYVRTARKDVIGILMQTLLQKALGVSPSKYWGSLFQMLLTEINQKHVLAYFHDEAAQRAAESFNMAGRIATATETATLLSYKEGNGWDYLHINNSNMAGAKANMFVSEKVTKDVTVNGDGTVTTKLTVDWKNPYQGSDCGLESGGLCLNAPLRNWVRVYTPSGSKLVESRGTQSPKDSKPVSMETYESLNKTVFEGFLIVNPLGTARLELTYTSPVKSTDGKYRLLIQKQPGTDGDEFTIKLGAKERKKFALAADTELSL
ncbi:DUF4012 domain-containing protein [Candidatus Gottesmanbacteria bacterium]|nr:DUF4012 domain-containing protein [Candidatus Gottesmanbacteria bacterium]